MSGWIKIEKDLVTDPRFMRMVRTLRNADVTHQRSSERAVATQLLGCLTYLWLYADAHVREDDTLDLGADEVDELVGVQGFTKLMPTDWLEVIDAQSVKLPGFHDHNGTEAKKKALTQKRVARHRIRTAVTDNNDAKRSGVTQALPDQTRLDQTRPEVRSASARTEMPEPVPRGTMEKLRKVYPGVHSEASWLQAERSIELLIENGAKPEDLVAGAAAYAMQQQAKGNTTHLYTPLNFFSRGHWRGPFEQARPRLRTAEEIEADEAARAAGGTSAAG